MAVRLGEGGQPRPQSCIWGGLAGQGQDRSQAGSWETGLGASLELGSESEQRGEPVSGTTTLGSPQGMRSRRGVAARASMGHASRSPPRGPTPHIAKHAQLRALGRLLPGLLGSRAGEQ